MPFSLQISAANKASVAAPPVLPSSGAQAVSALGDAFATLMQAALPGAQTTADGRNGYTDGSTEQADKPVSPLRARKSISDLPDSAAALVLAPPTLSVAVPDRSSESSPTAALGAAERAANVTLPRIAGMQQDAPGPNADLTTDIPVGVEKEEPTNASAHPVPELQTTSLSALDLPQGTVLPSPALQPTTLAASAVSASSHSQVSSPAITPSSIPASSGSDAKSVTRDANQRQLTQVESPQPNSTVSIVPSDSHAPLSRGASMSMDASRKLSTGDAAALVSTTASDSPMQTPGEITALANYASSGIPNTTLNTQASSGDASSETEDDRDGGTTPTRKGSQAASRVDATSAEGDSRVGMSGWIASAQHFSGAAAQRAGAESAPLASSGMTNMSLDRIASDSSARRLTNALHSDMSFGVQTEAFGKINVQAALHGDQLASQISLEHAHLHASTLAAHMPVLELRLGEKYNLDATVTVRDSGTSAGTNQQPPSQGSSKQNTASASLQKSAPASANTGQTATLLPGQQPIQERLPPAAGRLDLVI